MADSDYYTVLGSLKRRKASLEKRIADIDEAITAAKLEADTDLKRAHAELDDVTAAIAKLEAE